MRPSRIVAGASLLLLSACSGSSDSAQKVDNPVATVTVTASSTSSAASDQTSSAGEPATTQPGGARSSGPTRIGDSVRVSSGRDVEYTVSALDVKVGVKSGNQFEKPHAGNEYEGVLAQFCLLSQGSSPDIKVSSYPWSLRFPDGTVATSTGLSEAAALMPSYPENAAVPVGTCVKGWIAFEGPANQQPSLVVYASQQDPALTFELPGA